MDVHYNAFPGFKVGQIGVGRGISCRNIRTCTIQLKYSHKKPQGNSGYT